MKVQSLKLHNQLWSQIASLNELSLIHSCGKNFTFLQYFPGNSIEKNPFYPQEVLGLKVRNSHLGKGGATIRMNFLKSAKGGGSFSIQKFMGFVSMKLIQKSSFRVQGLFFQQL